MDEIVETIRNGIRPTTRVVATTFVDATSGVKLRLREVADMVARTRLVVTTRLASRTRSD